MTKGGRIFEGHFWKYFFSPSCNKNHFYSFFPCSIAKILVVLQAFETLEAPLLAPLFYFGKTHFYSMFLNSTLPIFNVSRLGQLSDLFLLLFFPLTIVEILMSCSDCCSLLHFCDFFLSLQHFAQRLWKSIKSKVKGVLYNFDLFSSIPWCSSSS